MTRPQTEPIRVRGRTYQPPDRPIALFCISGLSFQHLLSAFALGIAPHLGRAVAETRLWQGRCLLPTVSLLNQASILTGRLPDEHGIIGSSYYDPSALRPVSLLDARQLREESLAAAAARAGRKVAVLLGNPAAYPLFSAGLVKGVPASSSLPAPEKTIGIAACPGQWTGPEEIQGEMESVFQGQTGSTPDSDPVAAALQPIQWAVSLCEKELADWIFAVTDDTIWHRFSPSSEEAQRFFVELDRAFQRMGELGVRVALVSDHGMSSHWREGQGPQLVNLEPELIRQFGPGFHVHLPNWTAKEGQFYLISHGIYVSLPSLQPADMVVQWLLRRKEVDSVFDRVVAVDRLRIPSNRCPDLVVLAARGYAFVDSEFAGSPEDLPRFGHGGRYEELVPVLLNFDPEEKVRQTMGPDLSCERYWELLMPRVGM